MRVAFLGDVYINPIYPRASKEDIFCNIISAFGGAVRIVANVEAPLFSGEDFDLRKWANLSMSPDVGSLLSGLDIACIANNHFGDFGEQVASESVGLFRSCGIQTTGWGENTAESLRPAFIEEGDAKLAVISLCCPSTNPRRFASSSTSGVALLSRDAVIDAIRLARRESASHIVLFLHWGLERELSLVPPQIEFSAWARKQGVSAVIGTHGHIVQPYMMFDNFYVFYGIGNFLFDDAYASVFEGGRFQRRIEIKNGLAERQSVVPVIDFLPDGSLRLVDMRYFQYDQGFPPRELLKSDLVVDVEESRRMVLKSREASIALERASGFIEYRAVVENLDIKFSYADRKIETAKKKRPTRIVLGKIRRLARSVLRQGEVSWR